MQHTNAGMAAQKPASRLMGRFGCKAHEMRLVEQKIAIDHWIILDAAFRSED